MASWEGDYGTFGMTTGAFGAFELGGRGLPSYEEVVSCDGHMPVGNGTVTLGIGAFHPYEEMNPAAKAEITAPIEGEEFPIAYVCVPLTDVDTGYERDSWQAMREAYSELCDAVLWRQ